MVDVIKDYAEWSSVHSVARSNTFIITSSRVGSMRRYVDHWLPTESQISNGENQMTWTLKIEFEKDDIFFETNYQKEFIVQTRGTFLTHGNSFSTRKIKWTFSLQMALHGDRRHYL